MCVFLYMLFTRVIYPLDRQDFHARVYVYYIKCVLFSKVEKVYSHIVYTHAEHLKSRILYTTIDVF